MGAAPLLGAPGASFLLELLGGRGCFSGREVSGEDKKVLDVGCSVHPSKLSAKRLHVHFSLHWFFFQLAFSAWLHRAHILYFRCMGWGGGNKCFSFSFNFLASHWTFIFISWVAYMQLLWLDPVRHLSAIARACTLNHKRKIKAAISYFHKWKDVSSIGRHWKKFCSLKILQLNY